MESRHRAVASVVTFRLRGKVVLIKQQLVIPSDIKIKVLPPCKPKMSATPFWHKHVIKTENWRITTGIGQTVKPSPDKVECDDCGTTKGKIEAAGSDEFGQLYYCRKCSRKKPVKITKKERQLYRYSYWSVQFCDNGTV